MPNKQTSEHEIIQIERTDSKWWGVNVKDLMFAVNARKANEAITKTQGRIGSTLSQIYLVEPYKEEFQRQFDERYPDKDIVQIIAFSLVEYPEDILNLTDEQRFAFDKLKGYK
jgi:hypothetical protein